MGLTVISVSGRHQKKEERYKTEHRIEYHQCTRGIEELASKRSRIAAKARTNPKERFTNAVGTDGVTRDVAVKNLS